MYEEAVKATVNGATVEGTPEEIAKLLGLVTPAAFALAPVIIIQPSAPLPLAPPGPYWEPMPTPFYGPYEHDQTVMPFYWPGTFVCGARN